MFLHADLGGRQKRVGDGEQPRLAIAMPAPIDWDGFEADVDGGEMDTRCNAGLTQDGGCKQSAERGRAAARKFRSGHQEQ